MLTMFAGTDQTEQGQIIAAWFGSIVGKPQVGPYTVLGWTRNGRLCNAVLFNDYTGSNIEMHMVGPLRREIIHAVANYAFVQSGANRLTAKPYRSNLQLRRVLERIGFKQEGVMKRYYGPTPDDDAFVYRLDRETAEKWIK